MTDSSPTTRTQSAPNFSISSRTCATGRFGSWTRNWTSYAPSHEGACDVAAYSDGVPGRGLGRAAQLGHPGVRLSGKRVLHPADDLRQDHAAVASCAHERAMRGGRAHRGEGALPGARFLQSRAHRVKHVRARVAIGQGVYVQRFTLLYVSIVAR